MAKGHVLVIPKVETVSIFDVEENNYANLWVFARQVAKAIEESVPCKRVGVAVIGLEVPHAHIHLIPLQSVEDINFSRPKLKLASEELQSIADKIKAQI